MPPLNRTNLPSETGAMPKGLALDLSLASVKRRWAKLWQQKSAPTPPSSNT